MSSDGPRVLLVDDDEDVRDIVAGLLADEGYRVTVAKNGKEALSLLERAACLPAVILLDQTMPVMDGLAFGSKKQTMPELAAIPLILLTGDRHARELAASLGAVGYVRKPLSFDDLLSALEKVCAGRLMTS